MLGFRAALIDAPGSLSLPSPRLRTAGDGDPVIAQSIVNAGRQHRDMPILRGILSGGGVTTFRHSILFLVVILLRYIS